MKSLILMLALFASSALAAQAPAPSQPPPPEFEIRVDVSGYIIEEFSARVTAYAELRRTLEKGLPPLAVTGNPADITRAETALATRIRAARLGVGQGNIFTDEVSTAFKQVLAGVVTPSICAAIRDDGPGELDYRTNRSYPKNEPLSTVPPSILAALPGLPEDVHYRFVGRVLLLHDTRSNLILDRIPNALRCPRSPAGR